MDGEREATQRDRGRRDEAAYGRGLRTGGGLERRARGSERGREGELVEIEDGGRPAHTGFEYSRRCYARGYTYIYGRWCMVCHDGSNSGIPGLKLTSH